MESIEYKVKDARAELIEKFSNTLEDFEDEIVVYALMRYWELCVENDDGYDDIFPALERVIEDFVAPSEFVEWRRNRAKPKSNV